MACAFEFLSEFAPLLSGNVSCEYGVGVEKSQTASWLDDRVGVDLPLRDPQTTQKPVHEGEPRLRSATLISCGLRVQAFFKRHPQVLTQLLQQAAEIRKAEGRFTRLVRKHAPTMSPKDIDKLLDAIDDLGQSPHGDLVLIQRARDAVAA